MNDLYGVDPKAPGDLRDLAELIRIFGPTKGRFILEFPSDWSIELLERMKGMSDIKRHSAIEAWVRKGRAALLPTTATFKSSLSWAENAQSLRSRERVAKLIGPRGCPATLEPIDEALVDPSAFPDASGRHIPRTPSAYVEAAKPLLMTASKIVMIDPYFRLRYRKRHSLAFKPSRRHRESLGALLKAASNFGRVEVFKLLVSESTALEDDSNGSKFERDVQQVVRDFAAEGVCLEYDLLDPSVAVERHPRYLLSVHGGLKFDWGFDVSDDGSTNHVEWIGEEALKPLIERFL